MVLPGATQPYVNSPIYARTNGYLVKWFFDIGAKVKQGDLLAIIDTPELDKQLLQARADLETAKSNLALSKTTAERWQGLVKTRSVSQQSTDQAVDNLSATQASVDSYAANVRRLEDLVSFEKVYAPFDGVITVRNTDTGWLINAGAGSPSAELFQLAQTSTLRIFVAVPEVYSRAARVGSTATLTLDEFPSETFHGKVTRTSQSIDMASRTLNTEIDVDNPYRAVASRGLRSRSSQIAESNSLRNYPFQHPAVSFRRPSGWCCSQWPRTVGSDYDRRGLWRHRTSDFWSDNGGPSDCQSVGFFN